MQPPEKLIRLAQPVQVLQWECVVLHGLYQSQAAAPSSPAREGVCTAPAGWHHCFGGSGTPRWHCQCMSVLPLYPLPVGQGTARSALLAVL